MILGVDWSMVLRKRSRRVELFNKGWVGRGVSVYIFCEDKTQMTRQKHNYSGKNCCQTTSGSSNQSEPASVGRGVA